MVSKLKFWFVITLCLLMGIIIFTLLNRVINPVAEVSHTEVATVREKASSGLPQIGGHFTLTDHNGVVRRDVDFRGKFMVVYFGYSFCPDICPTALSSMTEALNMLGIKANKVQPLFITIDPKRDTVEQMAEYMENFHPKILGLTGTLEQVKKAAKAYKVYVSEVTPDGTSAEYLVDHSSIIYIMDPRGKFVAHFNHETPPEQIADGLRKAMG